MRSHLEEHLSSRGFDWKPFARAIDRIGSRLVLLLGAVVFAQEATASSHTQVVEHFPGFSVVVAVSVGRMEPAGAEGRAVEAAETEAHRRIDANLPLLRRMLEHFKHANHPYPRLRDRLGDFVQDESQRAAVVVVPLASQVWMELNVKPGLGEDEAFALATQFAASQFFAGGPGLDPAPLPASGMKPAPIAERSMRLVEGLYGALRCIVLEQHAFDAATSPRAPIITSHSFGEVDARWAFPTAQLLSAMLHRRGPPRGWLESVIRQQDDRSMRLQLLRVAAALLPGLPDPTRTAGEWVRIWGENLDRLKPDDPHLEGDEQDPLRVSQLLGVPAPSLVGQRWLSEMQSGTERQLNVLYALSRSPLGRKSTVPILEAAFSAGEHNWEVMSSIDRVIAEAHFSIEGLDPFLSRLLDARMKDTAHSLDSLFLAIAVTRMPLTGRGALLLRLIEGQPTVFASWVEALLPLDVGRESSSRILSALAIRYYGETEVRSLVQLTEQSPWRPKDLAAYWLDLYQSPRADSGSRSLLEARLRALPGVSDSVLSKLDAFKRDGG